MSSAIDVPALFLEIAAPEFIQHLDRSRSILHAAASSAEEASRTDADLLELYRGVIDLQKMHNAFNPSYVPRPRCHDTDAPIATR